MAEKTPLIIIAQEYDSNFINNIIDLYLNNNIPIILLKSPYYGDEEQITLKELATISNTKIYSNNTKIEYSNLGNLEHISISKEFTNFKYLKNPSVKLYLKSLNNKENKSEFDIKRIAMLNKGFIEIKVGAQTTTERREKLMRYKDALCSLNIAQKGVAPGGGLTFLKCSLNLNDTTIASNILKEALSAPINQILENATLRC